MYVRANSNAVKSGINVRFRIMPYRIAVACGMDGHKRIGAINAYPIAVMGNKNQIEAAALGTPESLVP